MPDAASPGAPAAIVPGADAEPAFDARALFAEGLEQVRTSSRAGWTDHNLHDPGITMLELLAYALTDLAYRSTLPFTDLIASASDNAAATAAQFHSPRRILPNRALTELDWRKLLIDLDGVKNAWVEPVSDVRLFADLARRILQTTPPDHAAQAEVPLRGLYRARVEFMDGVGTQAEREAVLRTVRAAVEAQRNLCEDFVEIRAVRGEYFAVCAEIDLHTDAEVTEVAAQLLFTLGEAIAPPVLSHTLDEMLARGRTLAEVFEGPLPAHGFIDDAELRATGLPGELRLSDLIGVAMDVPGVRALREVVVNPLVRTDEADENALDADPDDVVGEPVPVANPWRIPVRPGRLPRLSLNQGRLVFGKRGLPVAGWNIAQMPPAVRARLAELREAARLRVETLADTRDPPLPLGRHHPGLADWRPVRREFPAVYGIGDAGLGERATPQRRAQALQLQSWLLFFDQLMADRLALLARAKHRLSVAPADLQAAVARFAPGSDDRHTLVARLVDSAAMQQALYAPGTTAATLADLIESPADAARRQHGLLDHLLARTAEDMADYAAIMAPLFGDASDELIADKAAFLQDVAPLGAERAAAYLQRPATAAEVWDTPNVSGLERRIARLLGIRDFSRRNLGSVAYQTYTEIDATPNDEWRFRVRHAVTHQIVMSSSTNYISPEAARAEMTTAIERGQVAESYLRKLTSDGRHYFNIVDAGGEVVARRIQYFDDENALEAAIAELQRYLRERYRGEGLYVVEHLLLRPLAADDPLLPICTDPGCDPCGQDSTDLDPYSYRLHVLLPAYAGRFQDMGFRQFVEQTIRRETPAHLLPTICWLGSDDMARFEQAWREWLLLHAGFSGANRREKLQALIDALVGVKNIYPVRGLFDCTGDDSKPPFILGRTSLGRGPAS
ncbi:MAG: diguanylate cyclase [Pseudomonadota bacterium]